MLNENETANVVPLKREGIKRGIYILPNLCTTASLFCGFYSVIRALSGDFVNAAWAVIIAGLFDFLDGRVARLTRAESEFGIEYDSLVDLASFGLAPAVIMYTWGLEGFRKIGWLAAFLYFACGALRLARFNVQSTSVEKTWFQGLPIPVAGFVCVSMVIFYDYMDVASLRSSYIALVMICFLSLLMVSTVPYRSFKTMHFRKRWSFFWLVVALGMILVVAYEPQVTIFFLSLGYVVWGVLEEVITLRKSREIVGRIRARRRAETALEMSEEEGEEVRILRP